MNFFSKKPTVKGNDCQYCANVRVQTSSVKWWHLITLPSCFIHFSNTAYITFSPEQMRDTDRQLRKTGRDIERDRKELERDEKKLVSNAICLPPSSSVVYHLTAVGNGNQECSQSGEQAGLHGISQTIGAAEKTEGENVCSQQQGDCFFRFTTVYYVHRLISFLPFSDCIVECANQSYGSQCEISRCHDDSYIGTYVVSNALLLGWF